jgi:2-polyprenyl-6-methoxyphenol hydroxylase-like FAD-dependent oxidoreductase
VRVVVIGAGVGGLVLAQALRRVGVEVSVHDRDAAAAATGGYRLHLDERACATLRRYLDPALYQALLGSSAGPAAFRRFTLADHRMRVLAVEPRQRGAANLLIGRVPLRRLLTHGLDDALRFGAEFTAFEARGDGAVVAHFADGSTDVGDLLVGADGVGSRVTTALAGHPTSTPLGISGLAGRTPLTPATRALLPDVLAGGPLLAFEPGGTGLFLAVHDPDRGAAVDPAACVDVPALTEAPALVWGLFGPDRALPARSRPDGADLAAAAVALLRGWAPRVRDLVAAADAASVSTYRLHAADPDTDLTPWPAGRVTALGDAVHAMPPTGGQAAATAIRDAGLLAAELAALDGRASTIPLAVHRYHLGMAEYAATAVRESLEPLRWQRRSTGPTAERLARVALPALAALARLRIPAPARPTGYGRA